MKKNFKDFINCFMTGTDVSTLNNETVDTVLNNLDDFWDYFDEYFTDDVNGTLMAAWERINVYFLRLAINGKLSKDVLKFMEDDEVIKALETIIDENQEKK